MWDFDLEEWCNNMLKSHHKHDITIVIYSGITVQTWFPKAVSLCSTGRKRDVLSWWERSQTMDWIKNSLEIFRQPAQWGILSICFLIVCIFLLSLYECMLRVFSMLSYSSQPVLLKDEFSTSLESSPESCQEEDEKLHNARSYLEIQSQGLWCNCTWHIRSDIYLHQEDLSAHEIRQHSYFSGSAEILFLKSLINI